METPGTPSPAQSAPAGKPGFLKKIPTPVLIAGGGATIGLAYAFLRDRNAETLPGGDVVDADVGGSQIAPMEGSYDSGFVPSGVAYGTGGGYSIDSGETVGAVGQTALESGYGAIEGLFGIIPDLFLAMQGDPVGLSGPPPPATPQAPPPSVKKKPVITARETQVRNALVKNPKHWSQRPRLAKELNKLRPGTKRDIPVPKPPTARENAVRKALMDHGPKWSERPRLLRELEALRRARGAA